MGESITHSSGLTFSYQRHVDTGPSDQKKKGAMKTFDYYSSYLTPAPRLVSEVCLGDRNIMIGSALALTFCLLDGPEKFWLITETAMFSVFLL